MRVHILLCNPGKQGEPGGPGRQRARRLDWCQGHSAQGGSQHQQVLDDAGQSHLGSR